MAWELETFRKARKKNGITLRSMAKRMHLSAPYLSDIETGKRNIPEKVVKSYLKLK